MLVIPDPGRVPRVGPFPIAIFAGDVSVTFKVHIDWKRIALRGRKGPHELEAVINGQSVIAVIPFYGAGAVEFPAFHVRCKLF